MDIVLAPYYVFMRGWILVFGDSVVALRVPSLIAMACAAGLTGVLGARLFERWIGVTAGCLFAVVPSVSRYAEEARPYAFAMCFAVVSVLAVVHRRWALVSLFVALTGLAHLIALAVLVAHPLFLDPPSRPLDPHPAVGAEVARRRWPRDVNHWAIAVAVGLVPVIPFAILGARQTGQVDWIDASWKSLATLPMSLTRSAVVAGILAGLALLALLGIVSARASRVRGRSRVERGAGFHVRGRASVERGAGFHVRGRASVERGADFHVRGRASVERGAGDGAALSGGATGGPRRVAALVVWAVAPPVLVFLGAPQFFYYRYLLFTLPALALLAAVGAARALPRRGALATMALCATVLALGAHDQVSVRKSPLLGDEDYRGAASYVAHRLEPGDTAYFDGFADHREQMGFAYELRRRARPGVCAELASCQRVWLVSNRVVPVPAGFAVLDARRFPGLEVQYLRRAP